MCAVARLVGAFVFNDGGRPAHPQTSARQEAALEWHRRRDASRSRTLGRARCSRRAGPLAREMGERGRPEAGTLRALIEKIRAMNCYGAPIQAPPPRPPAGADRARSAALRDRLLVGV